MPRDNWRQPMFPNATPVSLVYSPQIINNVTVPIYQATGLTTSSGATLETSENTLNNVISKGAGKSVWFQLTPAASGTLTLTTIGSTFDTQMGIKNNNLIRYLIC